MEIDVPSGYYPLPMAPGFDVQFGQMYGKDVDGNLILGFRVQEHHLNVANTLHGGAIATFADWQILAAQKLIGLDIHAPTINLSLDYLSMAVLGDWIECTVRLQKQTRTMIFTHAEITSGENLIARANAIYYVKR